MQFFFYENQVESILKKSRLSQLAFFITHPKKRCHHILIIIISIAVIKVESDFSLKMFISYDDVVLIILVIKLIFIKALHFSSPYSLEM